MAPIKPSEIKAVDQPFTPKPKVETIYLAAISLYLTFLIPRRVPGPSPIKNDEASELKYIDLNILINPDNLPPDKPLSSN